MPANWFINEAIEALSFWEPDMLTGVNEAD
jgi:hypothetical protein